MTRFTVRNALGFDEFMRYLAERAHGRRPTGPPQKRPPIKRATFERRAPTRPIDPPPVSAPAPRQQEAPEPIPDKQRRKKERRRATSARQRAKACRTVRGVELLAADPCAYCAEQRPTTHDHIEPVTRGGAHSLDNLVRACWRCNREKNTQSLLVFLARRRLLRAQS